jgi:hypothetical protein
VSSVDVDPRTAIALFRPSWTACRRLRCAAGGPNADTSSQKVFGVRRKREFCVRTVSIVRMASRFVPSYPPFAAFASATIAAFTASAGDHIRCKCNQGKEPPFIASLDRRLPRIAASGLWKSWWRRRRDEKGTALSKKVGERRRRVAIRRSRLI